MHWCANWCASFQSKRPRVSVSAVGRCVSTWTAACHVDTRPTSSLVVITVLINLQVAVVVPAPRTAGCQRLGKCKLSSGANFRLKSSACVVKLTITRNILDCDQSNVLLAHYFQFSAKFLKFCRRMWLTSLNNSALKTFARRKYLGYISDASRVIANFGSKFVAIATRVGRGRIWLTSLNSPTPKTRECKNLGHISHTSRVIATFSSNFVAMATRVGRGRIWLTSLNSPTPRNPC